MQSTHPPITKLFTATGAPHPDWPAALVISDTFFEGDGFSPPMDAVMRRWSELMRDRGCVAATYIAHNGLYTAITEVHMHSGARPPATLPLDTPVTTLKHPHDVN